MKLTCRINILLKIVSKRRHFLIATVFMFLLGVDSQFLPAKQDLDVSYLNLGLNQSDVVGTLLNNAVEFKNTDSETISCSPIENLKNSIEKIHLIFEKGKLNKITTYFQIPPLSPDANSIISNYQEQKQSISSQYGSPAQDIEEMKAERIQDRMAWITRGRAYYRTIWNVGDTSKISLWLLGGDSGIEFFKSMESTRK